MGFNFLLYFYSVGEALAFFVSDGSNNLELAELAILEKTLAGQIALL